MLELRGLHKTYDHQQILRGVSLRVDSHETICLLGPSGSGKSTLLRISAGLEAPDSGKVFWDRQDLASVPAHLRDFGLVFQDYVLFPHLNVFDNIAFGLKMKDWARAEIRARLAEVLDLVNLTAFENRKVTDLSGGEQQRVALARALAPRPRLLMFDEPLGALDRALKENLLVELRAILHRTGIPAIYVTHDQEEAFAIADRVLLLHAGRIIREGTPSEVWERPASAWTATFLGLGNVIRGVHLKGRKVETEFGIFSVGCGHKHRVGSQVHLLARPFRVEAGNVLRGRAADVVFERDHFKVTLENGLYFHLRAAPKIGGEIEVKVKLECLDE